jgi:histidine triad (HIT) family protein
MATCVFCPIIAGTARAHRVMEDDLCVAFLDARPLFPGHTLVVPRAHHETLRDLPETTVGRLFVNARRISMAMDEAIGAQGTFVALNDRVSQSVPHVHVHVVPRRKGDGLRGFFWPRHQYGSDEEAEAVAAAIRRALR